MAFYHKDSIKRQLCKHCLQTAYPVGVFGNYWKSSFLLRLVWTISLFCSFCSPLCVHVHVLTPQWLVTKNTYWSVLGLEATLIQLFLVTFLGIHWYCFLTKWWAKYWSSLLVRSHYSSAPSQESEFILCYKDYSFFTVAHRTLKMFEIGRMQGEDDISGNWPCRSKQDLWQRGCEEGGWLCGWAVGSRVMVQVTSVHFIQRSDWESERQGYLYTLIFANIISSFS